MELLQDALAKESFIQDGKTVQYTPKMSLVKRLNTVLGSYGNGWQFEYDVNYHMIKHGEHTSSVNSVSVTGMVKLNIGSEGKECWIESPTTCGGAAVNEQCSVAEAIMKAENVLFKRALGYFGIGEGDDVTGTRVPELSQAIGGNAVQENALGRIDSQKAVSSMGARKEGDPAPVPVSIPVPAPPTELPPPAIEQRVVVPLIGNKEVSAKPSAVEKLKQIQPSLDMMGVDNIKKLFTEYEISLDLVLNLPGFPALKRFTVARFKEACAYLIKNAEVAANASEENDSLLPLPAPTPPPAPTPTDSNVGEVTETSLVEADDAPAVEEILVPTTGHELASVTYRVNLKHYLPAPRPQDNFQCLGEIVNTFMTMGIRSQKDLQQACADAGVTNFTNWEDFSISVTMEEMEKIATVMENRAKA